MVKFWAACHVEEFPEFARESPEMVEESICARKPGEMSTRTGGENPRTWSVNARTVRENFVRETPELVDVLR